MVTPIVRGSGITESERYLAKLADATFLDLWSYPNTFIDKKVGNSGDGKELCDLLVVFGDDVLIFSDKTITWPDGPDINLSWSRWYKRAVQKSVDQIRGAERWIKKFPERIFIDNVCTQPLPFSLPGSERRMVHGIAVVSGAHAACKDYTGDEDGSLMVLPNLEGDAHKRSELAGYMPFAIGDVDPEGAFVHVFDENALDLVMRELDTAADFVRYLEQRIRAIREKRLLWASGEADLLALYLQSEDETGGHVFPSPASLGQGEDFVISIEQGLYEDLITSESYQRKKIADKQSYVWDDLIGMFTKNILGGTSVAMMGEEPSAALAEPALRIMARENRFSRRVLGETFVDTLRTAEKLKQDRFTRVVVPFKGLADPECGYVFMVLAYPTDVELKDGYEQYRQARTAMLHAYCQVVLYEKRQQLKRVVGIAVDASSKVTGRKGGSEDLVAVEITNWTPELERDVREARAHYDIMKAGRYKERRVQAEEFPAGRGNGSTENRHTRRKAAAKSRKR